MQNLQLLHGKQQQHRYLLPEAAGYTGVLDWQVLLTDPFIPAKQPKVNSLVRIWTEHLENNSRFCKCI